MGLSFRISTTLSLCFKPLQGVVRLWEMVIFRSLSTSDNDNYLLQSPSGSLRFKQLLIRCVGLFERAKVNSIVVST